MSIVGAFIVPHPPLIVKEVGEGREETVRETINSYQKISEEIAFLQPETIIISSPHAPLLHDSFYLTDADYLEGDFSSFQAPSVSFKEKVDQELVKAIKEIANQTKFPINEMHNTTLDHGTMVPLYFIRQKLPESKIVVLGLSGLPFLAHYRIGQIIQEAVNQTNKRVVYIASGDLSHKLQEYGPYGYVKEGPIYDKTLIEDCKNKEFGNLLYYSHELIEKASPCGHLSFIMMAGSLDKQQVDTTFYSYQDLTGVGYGLFKYIPTNSEENRDYYTQYIKHLNCKKYNDMYIDLAQKAIIRYVLTQEEYPINQVKKELLQERAGVFVSIHKNQELRGCIGTFLPTTNSIGEEIIQNAISAATNDNRFYPIQEEELEDLEISVDILSTPEPIKSLEELDPKKYGVIVTSGYKRGLLLPDLEKVDDIDTQIHIAMKKGNIEENEEIKIQRFTVIRHKE